MRRALLLHVGDDVPLRTSRSAILRSHFEVIDCLSRDAHEIFMAQPNVDAVVICGSVEGTMQNLLVTRIRQYTPQTLILQIGTDLRPHAARITLIDPHAPHKLVAAIAGALMEHARDSFADVPQGLAPSKPSEQGPKLNP